MYFAVWTLILVVFLCTYCWTPLRPIWDALNNAIWLVIDRLLWEYYSQGQPRQAFSAMEMDRLFPPPPTPPPSYDETRRVRFHEFDTRVFFFNYTINGEEEESPPPVYLNSASYAMRTGKGIPCACCD